MKRYIVFFKNRTFDNWVWAANKREARKQMAAYARAIGDIIVKIEEA